MPPSLAGSLGELFAFLLPSFAKRAPRWPPDVFALAATALHRSGAYLTLSHPTGPWWPEGRASHWPRTARAIGRAWRARLNAALAGARFDANRMRRIRLPDEVRAWWAQCVDAKDTPVSAIASEKALAEALIKLCVVADEASAGIVVDDPFRGDVQDDFLLYAISYLIRNDEHSLCSEVSPEKACVLGKKHTPQRGATLRAITHHLALLASGEVDARWRWVAGDAEEDVVNCLLLPWPTEIATDCFTKSSMRFGARARFFTFERECGEPGVFRSRLESRIKAAKRKVGSLHAVVLPELALTTAEYLEAEDVAIRENVLLIAGVLEAQEDGIPVNCCYVQPYGLLSRNRPLKVDHEGFRYRQVKHHPWCLDRPQIIQYGLGSRLPASRDCWELTDLEPRRVLFSTVARWMTFSVLICEDLARQEPALQALRAVGPNLVVALLMDGPQLVGRWPARYASILTEDPGSSVLTLTSLGMSTKSRPLRGQQNRGRTVALWSDIRHGFQEIELPENSDACVLSLVQEEFEEFTVDWRGDGQNAHFPVFAGVSFLETPPEG